MYQLNQTELKKFLDEQLYFLQNSAESFDIGFDAEAKRMAVTLRVLLHDTPKSTSLLNQLNMKNILFYDSSIKMPGKMVGPYEGLVMKALVSSKPKYVAPLDDVPIHLIGKYVAFNNYWQDPVIIDTKSNKFSRKDLVCSLANKEGGAHVDPKLDDKYAALSRGFSMGWTQENNSGTNTPFIEVEKAAIRQITHEVLSTLSSGYPLQKKLGDLGVPIISGISISNDPPEIISTPGRNESCVCGSKKKWKKCHGR